MKVKLHRLGRTQELENFVDRMNIGEEFDYNAQFIFIGKSNGELVFVNVFRLEVMNGQIIPRFIHILLDKPARRSKFAIDLMKQAEQYLTLLGYKTAFAYILHNKTMMGRLAQKFGYVQKGEDNAGKYYWKTIGGGR